MTPSFLDQVYVSARTCYAWEDKPVPDSLLQEVFDLAKLGPTSANCCPLRVVFVKTREAKEKLKQTLDPGNIDKTMSAPVTAIFGYDQRFYDHLVRLFPFVDAKSWFEGNDPLVFTTAFRNATLQAAYFILAARALGLDCGPMSGFQNDLADTLFFQGTSTKSNFLCNLGFGKKEQLPPRSPRFDFAEVCQIV